MANVTNSTSEIELEDKDLIEQLGKVQNIHNQIRDLRRLLPSALLDPARQAVAAPRKTSPRDVAFRISKTVQKGREDFQVLKKAWHDEKMKQLLQEATSTDVAQGTDAWTVDYQSLLSVGKTSNLDTRASDDVVALESIDDAKTAIDKFSNPESKLQISPASEDSENLFPLAVEVARLRFDVLRAEQSYKLQPAQPDNLAKQVAEAVNKDSKSVEKAESLLQLLESYHDLRTHKCDACANLVDAKFDLPIVRRRAENSTSENTDVKWLVYHTSCAP